MDWISGFQVGFLDFRVDFRLDFRLDFWILEWISEWISGFQFRFLPTVCEISFVTNPSTWVQFWSKGSDRNEGIIVMRIVS